MNLTLFTAAFRELAAIYLLVLAAAAVLGAHRGLLAYPFHAAYSVVRLVVMGLTLGRVKLTKDVRRTHRRNARRWREARSSIADWRERNAEERALAQGKDPYPTRGGWASAENAPAPSGTDTPSQQAPKAPAGPAPRPSSTPLSTPPPPLPSPVPVNTPPLPASSDSVFGAPASDEDDFDSSGPPRLY